MMKNTLLALAISSASFGAMADLAPMTDTDLSEATGQSGIIVGITIGSVDATDILNVDYSNAGFKMDAFKWEVDAQTATADGGKTLLPTVDDGSGNRVAVKPGANPGEVVDGNGTVYDATDPVNAFDPTPTVQQYGGILVSGISVGGGLDLVIDAVAGGGTQGDINGLGISFQNSNLNIKMDSVSTYSQFDKAPHSLGSFEMIGMNLDGTSITISGRD